MQMKSILSSPKNNRCQLLLETQDGFEFLCWPYFPADIMFDMLAAGFTYLQTGAAAVNFDCGTVNYTLIFSKYMVHILDENTMQINVLNFASVHPANVCKNVAECYLSDREKWTDLSSRKVDGTVLNEETAKELEDNIRKKMDILARNILALLPDNPE